MPCWLATIPSSSDSFRPVEAGPRLFRPLWEMSPKSTFVDEATAEPAGAFSAKSTTTTAMSRATERKIQATLSPPPSQPADGTSSCAPGFGGQAPPADFYFRLDCGSQPCRAACCSIGRRGTVRVDARLASPLGREGQSLVLECV